MTLPTPRESLDRCALRAQLRGDAMLGTAFPAARLLLVEQPGPWGPAGLTESHCDREVATAAVQRAAAAGVRVIAIRRPGRTPLGIERRWYLVDTAEGGEAIRAGTFGTDDELLEVPLDGSHGSPDVEPLYLVCAHSKHDTCCALRGRPVAAALAQLRPGRVWESSHLGGDRFAANVLVLPAGLLYGRVLPFAAEEFVAAAEADEVVGALLRGRVGLPPVAQAALAFGYEHLALRRRSDLRVLEVTGVNSGQAVQSGQAVRSGQATVRLAGPHGELVVTVAVESLAVDGLTCSNAGPGHYLRYRPLTIQSVSAPRVPAR